MRPHLGTHSLLGAVLGALVAVGACGGATASEVPSGSASQPSATSASAVASAGASGGASGGVVLPDACVTAIRDYLVAIEPIVSGVDWRVALEVPPEIADQLEADAFDPDMCPDISAAEAHAAWAAIAADVAPDTLDYIDFIYRP